MRGNNGVDWIEGGGGNDNIGGGSGQDSFVFREAGSANADVFNDFASNWDNIQLDAAYFTALGGTGRFSSGDARFWSSSTGAAHDADDRIIYNTTTRQIWYDADGNGAAAAQLIGTLNSGATLIASDLGVFGTPSSGSGQTINGTSGNDSLAGGPGNDTINGFAGDDTIDGAGGNDSLDGGAGADLILGGAGDDTIVSDSSDTVDGGAGFDTQIMQSGIAGAGIERLILRGYSEAGGSDGHGNELDNVIIDEGPGNAFLYGNGGNDTLIGGAGFNVFVFEGNPSGSSDAYGHDSVDGGGGIDWLFFEGNSFAVTVDFRNGTVVGGSPEPASVTFVNVERAQGTILNDVMYAGDAGNWLNGYGGNDTLIGAAGADVISGDAGFGHPAVAPGNDSISGGGGNDSINGEEGNDWIDGGSGNDLLTGDAGIDNFVFTVTPGAANADQISDFLSADDQIVLDGGVHANSGPSGTFAAGDARFWSSSTGAAHDADDRVIYNTSNGQLWYDADGNGAGAAQLIATLQGAPTLAATDITIINGSGGGGGGGSVINGTSNADTLTGTSGNDTINGLGGNDLINASAGADLIDGGTGFDTIQYRTAATSAVVVDFGAGTIAGGFPGSSVSFSNIERVIGGDFNDSMTGSAAGQNLTGQGGSDTLWGAGGVDTLWGGGGNDFFVFREMGTANADRIGDLASGADKLQLDDSAFTAIGALGNFTAGDGRFWAAAGATAGHDANDRVIYNSSTGALYYDADGSGSGAAQLIATLSSIPTIAATDIAVI